MRAGTTEEDPVNNYRMIAAARAIRGQTQQELADALADATGDEWSRNAVAAIENGRRAFTVDTLMALAEVQEMDIEWYLAPPAVPSATGPSYPGWLPDMALAAA